MRGKRQADDVQKSGVVREYVAALVMKAVDLAERIAQANPDLQLARIRIDAGHR